MILVRRQEITPNNQMSDRDYRNLKDRLSYSALKQYTQSRSKFMKEYILGEYVKKEDTLATLLGGIVHIWMADPNIAEENYDISCNQEFSAKYVLSKIDPPAGQMGELCQALLERSRKTMDVSGKQNDTFTAIFKDAVDEVKYEYPGSVKEVKFINKNLETILELFTKPDKKTGNIPEDYYKEALKDINKTLISMKIIESAEKIVKMLREHPYTAEIVNMVTAGNIEVFNELVVLYSIDNIQYRSMIDKLIIDHEKKTLQPFDYKCSWSVETGFEYSYLQYSYYLQVGLYAIALEHWKIEHKLQDYKVLPMRYITVDTTGNSAPIVYIMSEQDVLMGQRGFSVRGKTYMGALDIHRQIQWNLESGVWNTSMDIAAVDGMVRMKLKYR